MAVAASAQQFLEAVRKSGLLEPAALDAALQSWGDRATPDADPTKLAGLFVRDKLLTRFQAGYLLHGKWRNFIVAGKYKLLEPIGSGGMGHVYLCEHVLMRRRVALKVLPNRHSDNPEAIERFIRESRAAAALDHPNIVRAYDLDRDGELYMLVMEYVDGVSLHDLVQKLGPLPPARAAHYAMQAATGLQHAHEAGWVHRDVKPANLLLDRGGVVKILDLGLARWLDDDEPSPSHKYSKKALLGTADFCAPEQVRDSHDVDIRADLYGLGATLYFLIAGRPPFGHGSVPERLLAHATETPRPLAELRPNVPVGLAVVVERLMAKEPHDRPSTPAAAASLLRPYATIAGDLAPDMAALGSVAAGVRVAPQVQVSTAVNAVETEPPPPPPPATVPLRPPRRPRHIVGLAVAGVGIAAVAFACWTVGRYLGRTPETPPVVPPAIAPAVAGRPAPPTLPAAPTFSELRRFDGHADFIESVAFIGDGKRFLSTSQDGTARLWDRDTGVCLQKFVGHQSIVYTAVPLPDGRRFVTTGADGTLRTWAFDQPAALRVDAVGTRNVRGLAVTADGARVLTGGDDKRLRVHDAATGAVRQTLEGHGGNIHAIATLPDGRRVVTLAEDRIARLWDLSTGKVSRQIKVSDRSYRIAVAGDGRTVVFAHGRVVHFWDTTTGDERTFATAGPGDPPTLAVPTARPSVAGRHVLGACSDRLVRVWDAVTGKLVAIGEGHDGRVICLACSTDGQYLLSGGEDATLRLSRLPEGVAGPYVGEVGRFEGHTAAIENVAFTPDGRSLISTAQDKTARVWDVTTGQTLATCNGHSTILRGVAMLPDGKQAVTTSFDRTSRLWDLATGTERAVFEGHGGAVICAAVNAEGTRLLTAATDRTLIWRELPSGRELRRITCDETVACAAVLPDGKSAITGGLGRTLIVWNLETGAEVSRRPTLKPVWRLALSPDGRTVAFGNGPAIFLCDVAGGVPRPSEAQGVADVDGVAFTPDGRSVVSTGLDGVVRLWDATTLRQRVAYTGHIGQALGVAVSPDGTLAASCGRDNYVRLWRLP